MSRGQRIALIILAAIVVVVGLTYVLKGKEIKRLIAVNSLFEEQNIVYNFSHMPELFFNEELARGDGPIHEFEAAPQDLPALDTWIDERKLTGIVVLHQGQLVHEGYFQGTNESDKRISWSVAKSYLSALTGILLDEGVIESIDDPVTKYVPGLIGSAYDGASLKDVLQMSSGVLFNEDYLDPKSDINAMGRALALGKSMDRFAESLVKREREPGVKWQYVSIDTHVIGMVIEGASNRRVADLISEKIIAHLGVETTPVYLTDKSGTAFVLGGLNMPTRDYARFGQMFLQHGEFDGRQVVPAAWIAASTVPSAKTEPGAEGYGYQWWIAPDAAPGEYYARGIYGQYIYINQNAGVVIAINSADRQFREEGSHSQNISMFREIAASLHVPTIEAPPEVEGAPDADATQDDATGDVENDAAYDEAAE